MTQCRSPQEAEDCNAESPLRSSARARPFRALSGSLGELAVRISHKGHHLVQRDNFERSNRTNQFQPGANRLSGIEQFELNLTIVSPSFEKYQHANTTAFERAHLRKIEHDNPGIFERCYRSTKTEGGFAPHDPSYAFDNPEFSQSINPQI
jgi:hypothetical protein